MYSHKIELVDKIVRVVEVLRDEPEGLSLQELASRTGYVKSSIHRILHSLRAHGYIEQEAPGSPYRLGVQFLVLASGLAARIELVKAGRRHLRELVDTFKESAYLAVLKGGKGVFVDVIDAHRDFRLLGPLGAQVHFHATAAGKALAAYLPKEARAGILASELPALTRHTHAASVEVEADWAEVRERGYAINDEETIVGAVFLAGPLFDSAERVCGSISVGVPKARYSAELEARIADRLMEVCRKLSHELRATGYVHLGGSAGMDPTQHQRKAVNA